MKDYKSARSDFLSALKFSQDNRFPSFIEASILTNLASAEVRSGDLRSARIHLERGLKISESPEAARERPFLNAVKAELFFAEGSYSASASLLDDVFKGKDFQKTTPAYKYFHELAADVYSKAGKNDVALQHFQAFKRLDDEARELMVNTNSALVAAQFDFANQDLKIARLQADQLKKDAELARSRIRITLIVLGGLTLTVGLLGFNFLSLRRSSRRITSANSQLSRANQSLEYALKARSDFLATTSHEIRTPLNGILGVTQVLLSDPGLSADVRDRISLMNGAGETMRAMVDDLLDMAKIESGTLTIEKGETDLGGLLDDAVRFWTDKAREKGLDLVFDRGGAPGRILEDGPRLRQIVFNLLSNAIKFTETGSVRLSAGVETAETGERLLLQVTDTGIGIPADKLDAVFESFQQVEGGVTRRFEGTGLGLAISRRLAEAMGGTLGVESQMGEGSTFTLILPLVRAGAAAAASAGASGGAFLIIEANALTQSVLKSVAAPLGLPVETTASPETAAEVLSGGYITAVLVDAAALGADRETRIAAIAGLVAAGARGLAVTWPSPDSEDIEAALAAGAVKVIAKPISAARLTEALRSLLPESA
jgi:signal transduction histidine kinase/CheY-like chemotaxis protein